jgi:hypothetical protein
MRCCQKAQRLREVHHIPLTNLVIVSPRIPSLNEPGRTKGVRKIAGEFGVSPSKVDHP